MRYMVVEHYTQGPEPVYRRAAERGRMLPAGLHYVNSWVVADGSGDRCYQLMETDDPSLFDEWLSHWSDLGTFEIVPVVDSAAAAASSGVEWQGGAGASADQGEFDAAAAVPLAARPREFPERGLALFDAVVAFLEFVHTTAVNKLAGLTEEQARCTPLTTSPAMSPLGLLKHLTAVLRQHVQIHIGGQDLPSLWRSDDLDFEFRLGPTDTISAVVAAFDAELERSLATLAGLDPEREITAHGQPNRAGRLLVDVLQECARHLGQLDVLRELIDGGTGE
jgi:hypothetical protein